MNDTPDETLEDGPRQQAINKIAAARQRVRNAQEELEAASAEYREAVASLKGLGGSERALARQLGLSQTALRDLLRTGRRASR